jgi:hypothetical protein
MTRAALLLLPLASALTLSRDALPAAPPLPALTWADALALGVGGRAFDSSGNLTYARWPAGAQADLTPGEWSSGLDSAGLFVQFSSNATAVYVNYTLRTDYRWATNFTTFSPIGMSGVDLYAFDASGAGWRWVASAFGGLEAAMAPPNTVVLSAPLFANASGWPVGGAPADPTWAGSTLYRLHFPQFNGVLSLAVGVPEGASLVPDLSWNATAPVLYLGTSITQGGVTVRPGQAYVARLSATLPRPVSNYGLCGSCIVSRRTAALRAAFARDPNPQLTSAHDLNPTQTAQPRSRKVGHGDFARAVRARHRLHGGHGRRVRRGLDGPFCPRRARGLGRGAPHRPRRAHRRHALLAAGQYDV